jgi:hypothetical protein
MLRQRPLIGLRADKVGRHGSSSAVALAKAKGRPSTLVRSFLYGGLSSVGAHLSACGAYEDFHKFFVVNYIATTHKLQGITITDDLLIFDWYPINKFANSLREDKHVGYTALSRVKTLNQIKIII